MTSQRKRRHCVQSSMSLIKEGQCPRLTLNSPPALPVPILGFFHCTPLCEPRSTEKALANLSTISECFWLLCFSLFRHGNIRMRRERVELCDLLPQTPLPPFSVFPAPKSMVGMENIISHVGEKWHLRVQLLHLTLSAWTYVSLRQRGPVATDFCLILTNVSYL